MDSDESLILGLQFVHAPPTTTASFNPTAVNGVYPGPVTVTLSASAASGFSVARTTYKLDGGAEQTYTAPFTISDDGDHTLVVQSTDSAGVFEVPKTFNVKIQANRAPTANAGGPYRVTAGGTVTLNGAGSDPDGDALTYNWDFDNNGSFETAGQNPSFSAAGLTAGTSRTVGLEVCDPKDACATAQATVDVVGALAIATDTLPSGTVGVAYSATLQASGGTTPYTWSIPAGTLPAGLSLDTASGVISGTPTAAGTSSLNVSVNDGGGQTASKALSLTINPASNPVPTATSLSSTPAGGPAFTLTVNGTGFVQGSKVHWNGSERPTTYVSATELKAEISLNDIATTGTANVTVVNPTPGGGTSPAPAPFSIPQGNRAPTVSAGGPYGVVAGGSITVTAVGSDPDNDPLTYAWDLDGNSANGFETPGQTPTFSAAGLSAGDTRQVRAQVCDDHGPCVASAPATVNILSSLTITTGSTLRDGTVGVAYTATIEATGGTTPYTWALESGSTLPDGLTLANVNNTAVISGTPTTAGNYSFSLRVTDSSQITTTKRFVIPSPPPEPCTVGQDCSGGGGGGGGGGGQVPSPQPDCTNFVLAPGSNPLPPGVTLDPATGRLIGTPTSGGTFQVTVQCTYNTNQTATATFTLTINNPKPAITPPLDPSSATAGGQPFTLSVTGTGFVRDSKVYWNGTARPTTPVGTSTTPTQLKADIGASDIAAAGTAKVTVVNSTPGGGTSNELDFAITSANRPPTANAGGPYSGAEGASIALNGTASDPDTGDTPTISWSVTPGAGTDSGATCQVGNGNTLQPTLTCNDDGSYTATLTVNDGKAPAVKAEAIVTVTNVAPTITGVSGATNALTGAATTFTGTATDPSSRDTAAGFRWQWTVDGGAYAAFGSPNANTFKATFSTCGDRTVSAKAKDDDDGVSDPFTTRVVKVSDLRFEQPLDEGVDNLVQKGRVVPVKITVGCGSTSLSSLSPAIRLVKGDVSPGTEQASDEIEAYSASAADTTGVMRAADGGYMYNLRVPDDATVKSGDKFTIRVRPFGDGNPDAAEYVVLRIR